MYLIYVYLRQKKVFNSEIHQTYCGTLTWNEPRSFQSESES